MLFYGLQKTTLIDYPKHIATTVFTGGCNMKCPFCHNPELLNNLQNLKPISEKEIFEHIEKRKGILEAVCITGGEPLLHEKLYDFVKKIKNTGLKVKIDTNGLLPEKLEKIDFDYVAMDIKTIPSKYYKLFPSYDNYYDRIIKSISIIKERNKDYEFRTTVVPTIVDINDIKEISSMIPKHSKYFLNQFRPVNTLELQYQLIKPYPLEILEEMKNILEKNNIVCEIRANYN